MRVLINATALATRGGLSVVDAFLRDIHDRRFLEETGIYVKILVSTELLLKYQADQLEVVVDSMPKRSLLHKAYYERVLLPHIVQSESFDAYLSLQNVGLPSIGIPQFVLVHQPIPFTDWKSGELEWKHWMKYRLLMDRYFSRYANQWNTIFVQTEWMKEAFVRRYKYQGNVLVSRPAQLDISRNSEDLPDHVSKAFQFPGKVLVYPTSQDRYKNIERLAQAVERFNTGQSPPVRVLITTPGHSTDYVKYVGAVPYGSILTLYQRAHGLIFPSLTETLGLPLLEARFAKLPILVSDRPYARELCGDSAYFFDPRDTDSIVAAITSFAFDLPLPDPPAQISGESYKTYLSHIANVIGKRRGDSV